MILNAGLLLKTDNVTGRKSTKYPLHLQDFKNILRNNPLVILTVVSSRPENKPG